MTSSRVSREAVDGLLDHSAAQARTLDELRSVIWFATDILLEVERVLRERGLDVVEDVTYAAVRCYLLTCPVIDADLHRLPMPERPGTLGDGARASGKDAAPSLGPGVDIVRVKCRGCGAVQTQRVCDACFGVDTSHAFDDLRVTEEEDGR